MEIYQLDKDIRIMCLTVKSFPDGIPEAQEHLQQLLGTGEKRRLYGISRPEGGKEIVYKAAVEELKDGEAEALGLERIILKSGAYVSAVVKNFLERIPAIGMTFQQLLDHPNLDPNGYCVECYLPSGVSAETYVKEGITEKDVRCMVRLKDKSN